MIDYRNIASIALLDLLLQKLCHFVLMISGKISSTAAGAGASIWRWVVRKFSLTAESSSLWGNRRNGGSMGLENGRWMGGGWAPAEWWHRESHLTNVPITGSSVKKSRRILGTESIKKMFQTSRNVERCQCVFTLAYLAKSLCCLRFKNKFCCLFYNFNCCKICPKLVSTLFSVKREARIELHSLHLIIPS